MSSFVFCYALIYFCNRSKTADILSRQIFTALRKDLQSSTTCWPVLSKEASALAAKGTDEANAEVLLAPLLAGVESRSESDRSLEIGLSGSLSLVISLVPASEPLCTPTGHAISLERDLSEALLLLELKYRRVLRLDDVAAAKKSADAAAAETALRASGMPAHAKTALAPVTGNILNMLSGKSGKIIPSKKSWQRFHELGCYSKGTKRTAFQVLEETDEGFECGNNLLDLQKVVVSAILTQQAEHVVAAVERYLDGIGVKVSVDKVEKGISLTSQGVHVEVQPTWAKLSYLIVSGTSSLSINLPKALLEALVSCILASTIR